MPDILYFTFVFLCFMFLSDNKFCATYILHRHTTKWKNNNIQLYQKWACLLSKFAINSYYIGIFCQFSIRIFRIGCEMWWTSYLAKGNKTSFLKYVCKTVNKKRKFGVRNDAKKAFLRCALCLLFFLRFISFPNIFLVSTS